EEERSQRRRSKRSVLWRCPTSQVSSASRRSCEARAMLARLVEVSRASNMLGHLSSRSSASKRVAQLDAARPLCGALDHPLILARPHNVDTQKRGWPG